MIKQNFGFGSILVRKLKVTSLNFEMDTSVGAFAGFRFFENFLAGYSYDISVNDFGRYNGGVHTFLLNYRLGDYWSKKKCACLTF